MPKLELAWDCFTWNDKQSKSKLGRKLKKEKKINNKS